jgi:GTP:adenosylcobinamide-phosphate guanylyltransferase
MTTYAGLVLAGRREGVDPFAESVGASHRALIPVCGVPMLLRVLRCLEAARDVSNTTVSIDRPQLLREVPDIASAMEAGRLRVHPSQQSVSHSVADSLDQLGLASQPVLVTTADHALLTPAMADHCTAAAGASDADLLVGMVSKRVLRAAHPGSTRTYIPLRGDAWSGANLFVFRTPAARRAAEFWMRAERHRKRPWRLAGAISPGALLRFALGRLDLGGAFAYLSRTVGCRVAPLALPFAEAAIDVDRPADLALAERILASRGEG